MSSFEDWNIGFSLYTEVSSFQGVGIEGFHSNNISENTIFCVRMKGTGDRRLPFAEAIKI